MDPLIIIPARGGSTRVPNKNLADINGKPLIYYSIKAALLSGNNNIFVSTDSPEIAKVSEDLGVRVPFLRPEKLSCPNSTSISVIIHILNKLIEEKSKIPEIILFKPPTNPFLTPESIANMIDLKIKNRNIDSVMSIFKPKVSALSYLNYSETDKRINTQIYDIEGIRLYDNERSQDRPISYASSPACKVTESSYFLKEYIENKITADKSTGPTFNFRNSLGYLISNLEAHDIDSLEDLDMAKLIIEGGKDICPKDIFTHT